MKLYTSSTTTTSTTTTSGTYNTIIRKKLKELAILLSESRII